MEQLIEIGKIINAHGLNGSMKVIIFTDNIKNIKKIYTADNDELIIDSIRPFKKDMYIIKLKGCDTINGANELKGTVLYGERRKLEEDTYYIADLIGCNVMFDNRIIGIVIQGCNFGAGDILYISTSVDKIYISTSHIKSINIKSKQIEIHDIFNEDMI